MFSEYASKFLAQSQSRLFPPDQSQERPPRNPLDRPRGAHPRNTANRSYLVRPTMPSPYQNTTASQATRFQVPFASRTSNAPAPLFYSATDDFREESDGEEHEREVADYYALQKSRRHFGASNLSESSEADDEYARASPLEQSREEEDVSASNFRHGRGIRSSWKGGKASTRGRAPGVDTVREMSEREQSVNTDASSKGKGNLVDVELASTIRESEQSSEFEHGYQGMDETQDDNPPAFQQFRNPLRKSNAPDKIQWIPRETDEETALQRPRPPSPSESVPPGADFISPSDSPRHDPFWAALYCISMVAMFASFFLVWLHTSAPDRKHPLGDTIYSTLNSSFYLLCQDTLAAVIVAVLWVFVFRSYAAPFIYLIVVAVPVILFSFTIYPFVSSYKGRWHGDSVQDRMMRWASIVPLVGTFLWCFMVYQNRVHLARAVGMLEFVTKILAASPNLVLVGFAALVTFVFWSFIWILMFTRVFLGGHLSNAKNMFIIDGGTWWLGVFFVLVYLWTTSVISGIQRATSAATVSQWYFHRLQVPAPSSNDVVKASLNHATSTILGTICLSTLLSLLVRLPLLLLPRRVTGPIVMAVYALMPTPIATLTNPLALTYAAIHSQPLAQAARSLTNMPFVNAMSPTTTLGPSSGNKPGYGRGSHTSGVLPYRLAKMILHATRWIMSLCLLFGTWVITSRDLELAAGPGIAGRAKGSLYAWVVGFVAGAIGWGVLGAMEGVMIGVLDAVVVCWGSEMGVGGGDGQGEVRYCREAGELFGES
ncbi:hypothetical protein K402DRAFT_347654 [Aulographum hederae CBS 113979]|uniref:Protein PNS1 n=1 Tax=Aulographum hederae CBS 113979 TaxID=1176131 RepID=A0A6G1HBV9_9PEZI|nr:hypothetical protein K402DRAFT_347654 [Aulographum hederae CBS 113979]